MRSGSEELSSNALIVLERFAVSGSKEELVGGTVCGGIGNTTIDLG